MRRLSQFFFPVASFVAVENASSSRISSPLFKKPGVERRRSPNKSHALTQRKIHYYSLLPAFQQELQHSLEMLAQQPKLHYPAIPHFNACPLDATEDSIFDHLRRNIPGVNTEPTNQDVELLGKRLFILCSEEHEFVEDARDENPLAHWGIAVPMRFSVA